MVDREGRSWELERKNPRDRDRMGSLLVNITWKNRKNFHITKCKPSEWRGLERVTLNSFLEEFLNCLYVYCWFTESPSGV